MTPNAQLIAELEHVAFCDYTIQKDLLDRAIAALSQDAAIQQEPDKTLREQIDITYRTLLENRRDAHPQPATEPVCRPDLTECPRCKNQIGKCDGMFAVTKGLIVKAELTDAEIGKAWDEANGKYRGTVTHWRILFNEGCRAVIAADRALRADNFVLVPREPTPEMVKAGRAEFDKPHGKASLAFAEIYKAMIAAAPGAQP